MSAFMSNSLKLSYDMLFDNSSYESEAENAVAEEPEMLTPEQVEELLQERDEQWENRLQQARVEAKEEGIEEGLARGKAQAEAVMEERVGSIQEMMSEMDEEFNQALEELKPHIAALVFEIIEKVLDIPFRHAQLQEKVQDEIIKFVEILDEKLHVKVTVSEMDFEPIQQALEKHKDIEHFTLRYGAQCQPGEYIIETKKESIIKNFKKMVADFKESISFDGVDTLELE